MRGKIDLRKRTAQCRRASGPADALADGREFEQHVDGRVAGPGMLAGEDYRHERRSAGGASAAKWVDSRRGVFLSLRFGGA
jgi:hypothetical protein